MGWEQLETLAAFLAGGIARTLISNEILPNGLKGLLRRAVDEILSGSLSELGGFWGRRGQEGQPRLLNPHPTQGESGRWKTPASPKSALPESQFKTFYSSLPNEPLQSHV